MKKINLKSLELKKTVISSLMGGLASNGTNDRESSDPRETENFGTDTTIFECDGCI